MADFLWWAITQLQLEKLSNELATDKLGNTQTTTPNNVWLQLHEQDRPFFDGKTRLKVGLSATEADPQVEPATLESRLGRWLMEKLRAEGPAVPTRPRVQPQAIGDITSTLFSAYQVDGGQLHLGGCQLTDYPFLRLSFPVTDSFLTSASDSTTGISTTTQDRVEPPAQAGDICHLFVGPDGSWVPDQRVRDLGLLDIEPIDELPPRIDEAALDAMIAAGRRLAAQGISKRNPSAVATEPVAMTLIWVKHADGHLQFTIGDVSTTLTFSDWAKLLKPPPYRCEHSGSNTFHLAATDDGRIDAWDQLARCERSGQRVLKQELLECSVTGQHVLGQFTEICPVSGKPCLSDEYCTCSNCQQRVSKAVIDNNQCVACQRLSKLPKDDPRLIWLLGEHPGLDRWKHWKLSETANVYIAETHGLFKRLLVVADKRSLDVRYLATSGAFSRVWKPIPDSSVPEFLN